MKTFKTEKNADLVFSFPDDLFFEEMDKQGTPLPVGMSFVDIVIEHGNVVYLVEVKDPSHTRSLQQNRDEFVKKIRGNEFIAKELVPKARDSYTFLHLMTRYEDRKIVFVFLVGLDFFDHALQKGILLNYKDRLFERILCETSEPWKRQYISDCLVLTVESWNSVFPNWAVSRIGNLPSTT